MCTMGYSSSARKLLSDLTYVNACSRDMVTILSFRASTTHATVANPLCGTGKINKITRTIDWPRLSSEEVDGGPAQQPGQLVGLRERASTRSRRRGET